MTDDLEREPFVPPIPSPRWDSWWHTIIEAVLEEFEEPREERERERGPGR